MQDEYVKAFEKIKMNDNRKAEMRSLLEAETAAASTAGAVRSAKTTRLSTGAKAGIAAAAAITITLGTLFIIPGTRNTISAGVRAFFNKEVPQGAVDAYEKEMDDREERVIPTDEVEEEVAAEIIAAVSEQDKAEDEYFETVTVNADYYTDADLNEFANYYAQQGYYIMDLKEDAKLNEYENTFNTRDWLSDGFFVSYHTSDNASGTYGRILVFKATEDQLDGFLKNKLDLVNYEREEHGQDTVSFDEMWSASEDSEGNAIYTGSWTGPEPEMKLLPSDSARFMNFAVTYDAEKQIVICSVEEGGGLG